MPTEAYDPVGEWPPERVARVDKSLGRARTFGSVMSLLCMAGGTAVVIAVGFMLADWLGWAIVALTLVLWAVFFHSFTRALSEARERLAKEGRL